MLPQCNILKGSSETQVWLQKEEMKSGGDRLETTVKEKAANRGITRMYGSTCNKVKRLSDADVP